jgi:hypothetical protein
MTDRQLLELLLANQVQLFKRLDIIEHFVNGLAGNAGTFPKDSIPLYAEKADDTVDKVLRSAEATLASIHKKLN